MADGEGNGDADLKSRVQQSPLASRRAQHAQERKGGVYGLFPLSYKEGFNQWWAGIPAAQAEHKVLSFVPHLQRPPSQMGTHSAPPSSSPSTTSLGQSDSRETDHVSRTTSLDDPHGPRRLHSRIVPLSGKDRALNEFSVERVGETVEQNLVILHGYGAGLGFFYKNFEGLSRTKGWQLYALDMLGMGRSSRPPFRLKSKERARQITEAEDWFVDSLEEWRVARKIDRFTLLGHSLGGYMAVAYALKYPGRLNKLILASPVGIPEDPYAVNAAMPEPGESTLANEFTQDQDETTSTSSLPESAKLSSIDNNNPLKARNKAGKTAVKDNNGPSSDSTAKPPPRRQMGKWFTYLWDANVSPFSLVRWSGPLGPRLVSGWSSRRFSHLPPSESQALHDYVYSLFRLPGSGEYALAYILAPGAFARSPLIRRIHGVGRQPLSPAETQNPLTDSISSPSDPQPSPIPSPSSSPPPAAFTPTGDNATHESGIPVVLMYGENDWMDVAGGFAAKEKMDQETSRILHNATDKARKQDNGASKVVIIRKAGHHVYLDGWEEFNEVVKGEMEDVDAREVRRRQSS